MGVFNYFAVKSLYARLKGIDKVLEKPIETQNELLKGIVQKAKDTRWGKDFGYSSIRNYEDFARRVPISTYEELFPRIEQIMKGEQNVLWPTPIKWFAKSSGTTNSKSKFIPVSPESLKDGHFKGGKDMLSLYLRHYPNSKAFDGKSLVIGGSHTISHLNDKTSYGDVSAVLMQNLPFWVQYMRVPSLKVALMEHWEEKIEAMAKETMTKNVTSITGVPTWTTVLLERILELSGKSSITEVWPGLEAFCHGAVAFDPYQPLFEKLIGKDIFYLESYNASEGYFGIQDQEKIKDMLLLLDHGVFYEFIPLDEIHSDKPGIVSLEGVKPGVSYAIIISTNAGLWRYKLGDTIKFTSTNPHRIKITGRTKHFINAFGEELVIENAEQAISKACAETGAAILNYTAAPVYLEEGKSGAHQWLIEFSKAPFDQGKFNKVLDDTLKSVNSDYEAKREKDIAVGPPKITPLPADTFYNWMKKKGKLGGQNKVPRLSNSREYVEDILELIK